MNLLARFSLTLAIASLAGTAANAQIKKYGAEAGWDIFVNEKMGPGCIVAKKLSPEVQLEMGIDARPNPKIGYMALYTKADANLTAGQQLSVLFDVDGQQFSGTATAQAVDGFLGASVPVNNVDFIYDLAKRNTLTILPAGREPIVVSLKGTDAAFKKLRACQEEKTPS